MDNFSNVRSVVMLPMVTLLVIIYVVVKSKSTVVLVLWAVNHGCFPRLWAGFISLTDKVAIAHRSVNHLLSIFILNSTELISPMFIGLAYGKTIKMPRIMDNIRDI